MIKQVFDGISERLTNSYYGYKIKAAYLAYGAEYDFCKFYICGDGIVHIYNSSMVIDGDVDTSDLEMLVEMTKPMSVEMSNDINVRMNEEYIQKHRTLFHVKSGNSNISFDEVKVDSCIRICYDILNESFENMGNFDSWYVDISHRIRHGVSDLYLFDSTTITKQFNINGFVFLSNIATAESARGCGTAKKLLYLLAERYREEGAEAYLFALDHRKSFYESIGFDSVYEDILYEMEG